jgi:hypothetical protein
MEWAFSIAILLLTFSLKLIIKEHSKLQKKKAGSPSVIIYGANISVYTEILSVFSSHFFPGNTHNNLIHEIVSDSGKAYCEVPLTSTDNYVTMAHLKQAFDSMGLTTFTGSDGIPSFWLSYSCEQIKFHLASVLHSVCFNLSHFPKKLKIVLHPYWKKDKKKLVIISTPVALDQ